MLDSGGRGAGGVPDPPPSGPCAEAVVVADPAPPPAPGALRREPGAAAADRAGPGRPRSGRSGGLGAGAGAPGHAALGLRLEPSPPGPSAAATATAVAKAADEDEDEAAKAADEDEDEAAKATAEPSPPGPSAAATATAIAQEHAALAKAENEAAKAAEAAEAAKAQAAPLVLALPLTQAPAGAVAAAGEGEPGEEGPAEIDFRLALPPTQAPAAREEGAEEEAAAPHPPQSLAIPPTQVVPPTQEIPAEPSARESTPSPAKATRTPAPAPELPPTGKVSAAQVEAARAACRRAAAELAANGEDLTPAMLECWVSTTDLKEIGRTLGRKPPHGWEALLWAHRRELLGAWDPGPPGPWVPGRCPPGAEPRKDFTVKERADLDVWIEREKFIVKERLATARKRPSPRAPAPAPKSKRVYGDDGAGARAATGKVGRAAREEDEEPAAAGAVVKETLTFDDSEREVVENTPRAAAGAAPAVGPEAAEAPGPPPDGSAPSFALDVNVRTGFREKVIVETQHEAEEREPPPRPARKTAGRRGGGLAGLLEGPGWSPPDASAAADPFAYPKASQMADSKPRAGPAAAAAKKKKEKQKQSRFAAPAPPPAKPRARRQRTPPGKPPTPWPREERAPRPEATSAEQRRLQQLESENKALKRRLAESEAARKKAKRARRPGPPPDEEWVGRGLAAPKVPFALQPRGAAGAKRTHFKAFERGAQEFAVGDFVEVVAPGALDSAHLIGQIAALWEEGPAVKLARLDRFYRLSDVADACGGARDGGMQEIVSSDVSVGDVRLCDIARHCEVLKKPTKRQLANRAASSCTHVFLWRRRYSIVSQKLEDL